MSQAKSVVNVFVTQLIAFVIFLVLIGIVNVLTYYIENEIFFQVVSFLNSNLILIILFSIIFMIGEMFSVLIFPLNTPYPIFNGTGAFLLVEFIFNVIEFLDKLVGINLGNIPFELLRTAISFLVLIIVVVVGYIEILNRFRNKKRFK
ncbi:MAG: hypothetical protein WC867_01755 [Candidatus Pacearchaeota archaeon]|jgi:hypothetical protein